MSLVLDASVALAWCLARANPDEARLAGDALSAVASGGAVVPALWYAEIANVLLVFERTHRLTAPVADQFLADLRKLPIQSDELSPADRQTFVMERGRRSRLSAYDAAYLELAERTKLPLATLDRRLATACREAGVPAFGD